MTTPKLGIFWIVGKEREIVAFSVPLDRAEHAGGFANYPHGHVQMWPLVLRSHPRLRGDTYDAVPRGRVTYDVEDDTFNLLVPTSYLNDGEIINKLVERFALTFARVRVIADEHYDPPRED